MNRIKMLFNYIKNDVVSMDLILRPITLFMHIMAVIIISIIATGANKVIPAPITGLGLFAIYYYSLIFYRAKVLMRAEEERKKKENLDKLPPDNLQF